ncbi:MULTISPECIES: DUF2934 domain-containing protein [Microvirga]|uniref:DUF2934 domain-containing protein n=1 Tax=Microvirga TaxID=186650 RepID=UPI001CFFB298|nr:DUF2934 domain-containing protein [Microvirga lenta]MCB5177372.1 DUF2934 domain-containing protein [Microvirga lenta]
MIDLEQKIRERAYHIWEQEGRVDGRAEEHWQMAKLELASLDETPAAALEVAAEPAKKKGRTAKPKAVAAVPAAAAAPAPRRRRAAATLQ